VPRRGDHRRDLQGAGAVGAAEPVLSARRHPGPLQRRGDQPVGGGDLAGPQGLQGRRRRPSKLEITTMKGLKRTVRRYGPVQGHRTGLHGDRLLPYETARRQIYLPTYRWVLENRVADLIEQLRTKNDV